MSPSSHRPRLIAICRTTILQSVLGPLDKIVRFIKAHGWPKALAEPPRRRQNYRDLFSQALS